MAFGTQQFTNTPYPAVKIRSGISQNVLAAINASTKGDFSSAAPGDPIVSLTSLHVEAQIHKVGFWSVV